MRSLLALLPLAACRPPPSPPPLGSWAAEVTVAPDRFAALTGTDRTGWIALHAGALEEAIGGFEDTPAGRIRALLDRAAIRDDLQAVAAVATERTFTLWSTRGLPLDDGMGEALALWTRCGAPPTEASPGGAARARAALYDTPEALAPLAATPVVQTATRTVWDPCALAVLADGDRAAAATVAGGDPIATLADGDHLAARFLAPWPTRDVLAAGVSEGLPYGELGATGPGLPPIQDTPLADVVALDALLADEEAAARALADDTGTALADELRLFPRLRQGLLVARARHLLRTGHPDGALTLADVAWDATAREVGPVNPPALAAVRARALVAVGRHRDALDALEPLLPRLPEAALAREWVADLVVLESVGRMGASRE